MKLQDSNNVIKRANFLVFFFSAVYFLVGCTQEKYKIDFTSISDKEDILITIETDFGDMKAVLYDETPLHKKNYINLVNVGFYDGLLFHRVIEDFMIQGGDPTSRNASADDILGRGDYGEPIKAEINTSLFHKKGVLSAARKSDQVNPEKKSNGSQFFIVQGKQFSEEELTNSLIDYKKLYTYFDSAMRADDFNEMKTRFAALQTEGNREDIRKFIVRAKDELEQYYNIEIDGTMPEEHKEVYKTLGGYPSLDGAYTAFGEVVDGLEVIDKIATVEKGKGDRPLSDVKMKITLEVMSKKEIMEIYNYKYL